MSGERFVVTRLTLTPQETPNRLTARFEVRHLIPQDVEPKPERIHIEPIGVSLNCDEVRLAQEIVYGGSGQLGTPASPGLVLELKEPGNGQYFLKNKDGTLSLLIPPRSL